MPLALLAPCLPGGDPACVQAQISELVASSERECTAVPHCFSTGVNLLASLHWAAAAGLELCEYCMAPSPLMRHLVRRHPTTLRSQLRPVCQTLSLETLSDRSECRHSDLTLE